MEKVVEACKTECKPTIKSYVFHRSREETFPFCRKENEVKLAARDVQLDVVNLSLWLCVTRILIGLFLKEEDLNTRTNDIPFPKTTIRNIVNFNKHC